MNDTHLWDPVERLDLHRAELLDCLHIRIAREDSPLTPHTQRIDRALKPD